MVSSENPISAAVAAKECLSTCRVTPSNPALAQTRSNTFGRPTKWPSSRRREHPRATVADRLRLNQFHGVDTNRAKLWPAFGVLEADAAGAGIGT